MKQNEKLIHNMNQLVKQEKIKLDHNMEKIVIVVSRPLDIDRTKYDHATHSTFQDSSNVTGKMIFIANKKRFQEFELWMHENGQQSEIGEIYIYDRFNQDGIDMIKRCSMHKHEFSWSITLKDEFKKCWFNGEVKGCKLWSEYAYDPQNSAWE